jgi:hypothetical protein
MVNVVSASHVVPTRYVNFVMSLKFQSCVVYMLIMFIGLKIIFAFFFKNSDRPDFDFSDVWSRAYVDIYVVSDIRMWIGRFRFRILPSFHAVYANGA